MRVDYVVDMLICPCDCFDLIMYFFIIQKSTHDKWTITKR